MLVRQHHNRYPKTDLHHRRLPQNSKHLQTPKPRIQLPKLPTLPLKRKVERDRHKQGGAQNTRPDLVVVASHPARADGAAAVQVDDDRVAQREEAEQGKRAGGDKRRLVAVLGAEVEQRHGDGADVDGVFELRGGLVAELSMVITGGEKSGAHPS